MKGERFRLSPAVLLSTLALCVAVGGSTFAVAALSSPEKKQVKKIARNQVSALAAGLSVAKAINADNATNATNAQNAAEAENADRLDNLNSTQIAPAVGDGRTADLGLTGTDQIVMTASITTPSSAALIANAAVGLQGNGGNDDGAGCKFVFDGAADSPQLDTSIPDTSFDLTSLTATWAHSVGPGAHTVDLVCNASGNATVVDGGMTVTAHL